jgi:hypothetical protein
MSTTTLNLTPLADAQLATLWGLYDQQDMALLPALEALASKEALWASAVWQWSKDAARMGNYDGLRNSLTEETKRRFLERVDKF